MKLRFTIIILLVWTMLSCSPERKLAKRFVEVAPKPSLLVLMPAYVFKEDLKMKGLEEGDYDSTIKTIVLDKLNDSILLSKFKMTYLKQLQQYDVNIYDEATIDDFMKLDSNAWVVNLSQVELQEYETVFTDREEFFGVEYTTEVPLNGINSAFWFEFSQVNAPENRKPEIMFSANDLYDQFDGKFIFDIFSGQMNYQLLIDTVTVEDFYRQIDFSARLFAGYTFDYLMNSFITTHISDKEQSGNYFRYDPFRKKLFITVEDKFIPLDQ